MAKEGPRWFEASSAKHLCWLPRRRIPRSEGGEKEERYREIIGEGPGADFAYKGAKTTDEEVQRHNEEKWGQRATLTGSGGEPEPRVEFAAQEQTNFVPIEMNQEEPPMARDDPQTESFAQK